MKQRLALIVGGAALVCPAFGYQYFHDDGTAELHAEVNPPTGTGTFMNEFNVVAGGEIVTSISILFRGAASFLQNGHPLDIRLWSDPNGDGIPYDAMLVSSATLPLQGAGSGQFVEYDIPDVGMAVGQRFFVGMTAQVASNQFWAPYDNNAPHQLRSWLSNSAGPFNASNTLLFDLGDLTVRANAVPEPASLAALALGVTALGRRRRKSGG